MPTYEELLKKYLKLGHPREEAERLALQELQSQEAQPSAALPPTAVQARARAPVPVKPGKPKPKEKAAPPTPLVERLRGVAAPLIPVMGTEAAMGMAQHTVRKQYIEEQVPVWLKAMKDAGVDLDDYRYTTDPGTGQPVRSDESDEDLARRFIEAKIAGDVGEAPAEDGEEDWQAALEALLAEDEEGGAAVGLTQEEKELAAGRMVLDLLAERGARERASIQELGDIGDRWLGVLKRAVTPELKEMIASRTFTEPEALKTRRVSFADLQERAEELPRIEEDIPEMQQLLRQLLPSFQGGGFVSGNIRADPEWARQQLYGMPGAAGAYGPPEADVLEGEDWYIDEYGYAQQNRPALQQALFGEMGMAAPSLLGQPMEEFGPAYEDILAEGGGYPTESARQFDVGLEAEAARDERYRQTQREMAQIDADADRDVASIRAAADAEAASMYAAAEVEAARLRTEGDIAQANATMQAAQTAADAVIRRADIEAQNRMDVANLQREGAMERLELQESGLGARQEVGERGLMERLQLQESGLGERLATQERGLGERLGAELGMRWAETSERMATSPRDFLRLAYRQSGKAVPPSLQNYLQPEGGAVPTMAGAPTGLQRALAQLLGVQ